MLQVIEHGGVRFAEILRADATVPISKFFSPAGSSFQFGLLAHHAGFVEPAHYHVPVVRTIKDMQQIVVVQRGVVAFDFFSDKGDKVDEAVLRAGDAIVLIHGVHSVRVLEDMQCVSVKQGPFMGPENDKVNVDVR